jgi:hypothetical protein
MLLAAGFHSRDKDVKQCMKEIVSRINLVQKMKLYLKEKYGSECLWSVIISHSLTYSSCVQKSQRLGNSSEGIPALQTLLIYSGNERSPFGKSCTTM